jgi:serine/threonine-protein kinase BUR1
MKFGRRTLAQEEELYGRTFRGITTMEDYEMAAKIGEGTFGVVTRAKEKVGGRAVALKKLIAHNLRDGVSLSLTLMSQSECANGRCL